jgi:hypothetical protein
MLFADGVLQKRCDDQQRQAAVCQQNLRLADIGHGEEDRYKRWTYFTVDHLGQLKCRTVMPYRVVVSQNLKSSIAMLEEGRHRQILAPPGP